MTLKRNRLLIGILIFVLGLAGLVWAKSRAFTGVARIQFYSPQPIPQSDYEPGASDGFDRLGLCQSIDIIGRVAHRLSGSEIRSVLVDDEPSSLPIQDRVIWVISTHRRFTHEKGTDNVRIEYRCRDRAIAIRMPDLFAEKIMRASEEESDALNCGSMVERLKIQLEQMKTAPSELRANENDLRRLGDSRSAPDRDAVQKDIQAREGNFAALSREYSKRHEMQEDARYESANMRVRIIESAHLE